MHFSRAGQQGGNPTSNLPKLEQEGVGDERIGVNAVQVIEGIPEARLRQENEVVLDYLLGLDGVWDADVSLASVADFSRRGGTA